MLTFRHEIVGRGEKSSKLGVLWILIKRCDRDYYQYQRMVDQKLEATDWTMFQYRKSNFCVNKEHNLFFVICRVLCYLSIQMKLWKPKCPISPWLS